MKNLPLLLITIFGTLALVVGVAFFFSTPDKVEAPANPQLVLGERYINNPQVFESTIVEGEGAVETDAVPAEVTVAVFSDFQCPACQSLEKAVLMNLKTQYPGRVGLVYRHFPLDTIHPYARLAAHASEAALDAGKFWEYHDILFNRQQEWSNLSDIDTVREAFISYATELDIDKDLFIEKMESEEVKERVTTDVSDGYALKVNSTPTVFVNNVRTAPQDVSTSIETLLQGE